MIIFARGYIPGQYMMEFFSSISLGEFLIGVLIFVVMVAVVYLLVESLPGIFDFFDRFKRGKNENG